MAEPVTPSDRWPPIQFYRGALISIICFIIAAAAFVSAVFLFSYCVPATFGGVSACVFPHWTAASIVAIGGALVLVVGVAYGVAAWLCLEPARYGAWLRALTSSGSEGAPQPAPDPSEPVPPR